MPIMGRTGKLGPVPGSTKEREDTWSGMSCVGSTNQSSSTRRCRSGLQLKSQPLHRTRHLALLHARLIRCRTGRSRRAAGSLMLRTSLRHLEAASSSDTACYDDHIEAMPTAVVFGLSAVLLAFFAGLILHLMKLTRRSDCRRRNKDRPWPMNCMFHSKRIMMASPRAGAGRYSHPDVKVNLGERRKGVCNSS